MIPIGLFSCKYCPCFNDYVGCIKHALPQYSSEKCHIVDGDFKEENKDERDLQELYPLQADV